MEGNPGGLVVFVLGAIAVFVPWAIYRLDPRMLAEDSVYHEKAGRK